LTAPSEPPASPDRAPAARTVVAVATYNERENIADLLDAIFANLPQADVLIIDDGSPDGTGRYVDERAKTEPRLFAIHRTGKLGLGSATVAGFRWALERNYDVVVTMDADFSHPPAVLPELVRILQDRPEIDVAIGSRYVAGGGIEGWPLKRRMASLAVNAYARTLLRLPIRDCSGAFRAYRASVLRRLDLDSIRSQGYSYLEEILARLQRIGARFAEAPITFVDRTRGSSKINLREAAAALGIILLMGLRLR
jgi:dolichol-phosphate mannosyltransferase